MMLEKLFELSPYKYGLYHEIEMMDYLVHECGYKFFIYGAGNNGKLVYDWCKKIYGIEPEFFVDKKTKCSLYDNVRIISLYDYEKLASCQKDNYIAVVSPACYNDNPKEHKKIEEYLIRNHVKLIVNAKNIIYPYKSDWREYFKTNLSKFEYVYNELADDISKDVFYHYLKTYITGGRYDGATFPVEYKYWGIDSPDYKMFQLNEQEVWLNVGAFCGDTIYEFLKCKNPFRKIIAVEPERYEHLKHNISLLGQGIRDKIQIDYFYLGESGYTIDNLYAEEHISLINMDIEGAEMDVLNSGIQTIKRERPILAICAYHKMDDLVNIPQYVFDNLEDYVLTLRKYPSTYGFYSDGIQQINELVLYAIPKERYCG